MGEDAGEGVAAIPVTNLPRPNSNAFRHYLTLFTPVNGDVDPVAWSLTLSMGGGNVPRGWLTRVQQYMQQYDLRGAASLERGGRVQHLHVQAVMVVQVHAAHRQLFEYHVKEYLAADGGGSAGRPIMRFKPCEASQPFSYMLGYVQKDMGQPHYRCVAHRVTADELVQGRADYATVAVSFRQERISINKTSLHDRVFGFWHANYAPFVVPFDVLLLHMLLSGKYVPEGSWLTPPHGGSLDFTLAEAWMLAVTRPESLQLAQVRCLFFGMHRVRYPQLRYFAQPQALTGMPPNISTSRAVNIILQSSIEDLTP